MQTELKPIQIGDRVEIIGGVHVGNVGTYKGRNSYQVFVEVHGFELRVKPIFVKKLGSRDA